MFLSLIWPGWIDHGSSHGIYRPHFYQNHYGHHLLVLLIPKSSTTSSSSTLDHPYLCAHGYLNVIWADLSIFFRIFRCAQLHSSRYLANFVCFHTTPLPSCCQFQNFPQCLLQAFHLSSIHLCPNISLIWSYLIIFSIFPCAQLHPSPYLANFVRFYTTPPLSCVANSKMLHNIFFKLFGPSSIRLCPRISKWSGPDNF